MVSILAIEQTMLVETTLLLLSENKRCVGLKDRAFGSKKQCPWISSKQVVIYQMFGGGGEVL